ncbi:MAG: single-stranded DNA-binding protein [Puniceicoccales bacterium]|nr:single-stranded DNA-binding protein [Puniceicoccales bacterium]
MSLAKTLIEDTRALSRQLGQMTFSAPVAYIYNPLDYAGAMHEEYLTRFADSRKRVIFLGMNPGPFGMAQTGVPFGEVDAVREFLGLFGLVGKPALEHPKKPVDGFGCKRSEVSGRRLWGLFASRFGTAEKFFAEHYVHNFCPLLFLENTKLGKNLTPEQLRPDELARVNALCDAFLRRLVETLAPEFLVGVGGFAEKRALEALAGLPVRVCKILHPSPASPAANKDWAGAVTAALHEAGVWA